MESPIGEVFVFFVKATAIFFGGFLMASKINFNESPRTKIDFNPL